MCLPGKSFTSTRVNGLVVQLVHIENCTLSARENAPSAGERRKKSLDFSRLFRVVGRNRNRTVPFSLLPPLAAATPHLHRSERCALRSNYDRERKACIMKGSKALVNKTFPGLYRVRTPRVPCLYPGAKSYRSLRIMIQHFGVWLYSG